MQIGFIVIWFFVLCYLLLFAFCLPNIQLVFYLSDTFSLQFPLGVNFHSLQDNSSIPLTCYIQGIWYSYLLFLLWILSLHSGFLSYRGMDRTFWSSSHAVYKEIDFLPFDFRFYLRKFQYGSVFNKIFFQNCNVILKAVDAVPQEQCNEKAGFQEVCLSVDLHWHLTHCSPARFTNVQTNIACTT